MSAIEQHPCSVEGCAVMLPLHLLMCRSHWQQVPAEMQSEVYGAWRARQRGDRGGLIRHMRAVEIATAAVESREPNLGGLLGSTWESSSEIAQIVEKRMEAWPKLSRHHLLVLLEAAKRFGATADPEDSWEDWLQIRLKTLGIHETDEIPVVG